jgi:hypothetical protein
MLMAAETVKDVSGHFVTDVMGLNIPLAIVGQ